VCVKITHNTWWGLIGACENNCHKFVAIMMETLAGDRKTHHVSGKALIGDYCIVRGNRNSVNGEFTTVNGDFNDVYGRCIVRYGEHNEWRQTRSGSESMRKRNMQFFDFGGGASLRTTTITPSRDRPGRIKKCRTEPEKADNEVEEIVAVLDSECVVCMERECNYMFQGCGHICICEKCAHEMKKKPCPICRKKSDLMKIYKINKKK
jgi:hypothetical protein